MAAPAAPAAPATLPPNTVPFFDIDFGVPFVDGKDANKKNRSAPPPSDKVCAWGNGTETDSIPWAIVELEAEGEFATERESVSIHRSIPKLYPIQPTFIRMRDVWPTFLLYMPNRRMTFGDAGRFYSSTSMIGGGNRTHDFWEHIRMHHNFLIDIQDIYDPALVQNARPDPENLLGVLRAQMKDLSDFTYVPTAVYDIGNTLLPMNIHLRRANMGHVQLAYTPGEQSDDIMLRNWYGKRFVAGMVRVDGHLISFIFDRASDPRTKKYAHLYIFDPIKLQRRRRAVKIIKMWRLELRCMGYPYHFAAMSFPLTPAPYLWAAPYISLFCVLQTLRGLTGERTANISRRRAWARFPLEIHPLNPPVQQTEKGNSELRFRDWCIETDYKSGVTAVGDSLKWVMSHMVACAAMELGLRSGQDFSPTPLRHIAFDLTPLASGDWSKLTAHDNMTVFGGFYPIMPAALPRHGLRLFGSLGNGIAHALKRSHGRHQENPMNLRPKGGQQPRPEETDPAQLLPQAVRVLRGLIP
ncbi:uncharacterized protein Triagg1_10882 [Trichoderma aggressivum f. europaeum]|uniref:Uncharacterized protein n=1 Tax=Trichoderma aggressivum f. europaeum TaxID=173218 RepID=A0AAE1LXS8_9HYPO|nr:hypothetical protein Triagg1_10882 [Trichoderma aggressivum f. europaeum]